MNHIVLLGDSIFDNAAYVNGGWDVITHFKNLIPMDWKATLKAVDGSRVSGVVNQVGGIPGDATHLVVSAGGNDALDHLGLLEEELDSAGQLLNRMADLSDAFDARYQTMLAAVLSLALPTAVCSVYYPRFPDSFMQRAAVIALGVFNDVIMMNAFKAGLPLIDLRLVCDQDEDYANPIEPSDVGGKKIAAVISRLVSQHRFESQRTEVFWRSR
jgi:hypothetical protein